MRGWKLSPNTAARRITERSSGASASIRAIAAASAESGNPPTPPGLDRGAQQIAQELGVASRPSRNDFQDVPRQRIVRGGELCHPEGFVRRNRLELESDDRRHFRRREFRSFLAPRYAEQPRVTVQLSAQVCQELSRGPVHVVRVLDLDQYRIRHHRGEEPADRLVQLRPAVLLGQHLDLGRHRHRDIRCDPDQRQPRRKVGHARRHRVAKTIRHDGVGILARDLQQLAQHLPPYDVRGRGGVGFAGRMHLTKIRRLIA